jgi:PTS system nitrogen regulatory IIA component
MMTTGVGGGLALPHIRVAGFPSPVIVIGLCKTPIQDYKSLDDVPVQMIVFIAADEEDQEGYLKLLGSVSGSLKDRSVIGKIMAAKENADEVLKLLGNE